MSELDTIAVTGLGTFIGRRTVDRLQAHMPKLRIVGIDWRRPYRLDERVRFHRIDLTEPVAGSRLAEVLQRERVDALLHAAFRTTPTADLEADHELETIGSLHVLGACGEAQVLIEWWREEYNELRPHSSVGRRPPAPVARLGSKAGSATLRRPWRDALASIAGLT